MKKSIAILFIFILVSISLTKTYAQDDCFGLGSIFSSILYSGIHGGYGFQQFSAEGFNNSNKAFNEDPSRNFSEKMDEFGTAAGFKFGINLFQFLVDDWIIGMKLSYHILKEQHESTENLAAGGTAITEYELTYYSFHAGLSFAYYISKHLDLKIADLMLTFNSADLEYRFNQTNQPAIEQELSSFNNPIGFNASTGLTFYIIPPYIAIEGTIGYSFFSIDEMRGSGNAITNFIDGGGLYAFAQLNIAIPFN